MGGTLSRTFEPVLENLNKVSPRASLALPDECVCIMEPPYAVINAERETVKQTPLLSLFDLGWCKRMLFRPIVSECCVFFSSSHEPEGEVGVDLSDPYTSVNSLRIPDGHFHHI